MGIRKRPKSPPNLSSWRNIPDDKEKYQAYLCSREWAEKRESVRQRSLGKCERCDVLPMDACHHLTYLRKYNEDLADLQAICNSCHAFTHGKSDIDPTSHLWWLQYVSDFRDFPVPEYLAGLGVSLCDERCPGELRGTIVATKMIVANRTTLIGQGALLSGGPGYLWSAFLALTEALKAIDSKIGFALSSWIIQDHLPVSPAVYRWSMAIKWTA